MFAQGHGPAYWSSKLTAWSWWVRFCQAQQCPLLLPEGSAADLCLARFAAFMFDRGLAAATLKVYTGAVKLVQREVLHRDIATPFYLPAVLRGAAAARGPPKSKPVLGVDHILALLDGLNVLDFDQLCVRVAMVLQLAGGWRVSNVVAAPTLRHTVRWGDVAFRPSVLRARSVLVVEHSSKTSRPGAGLREVTLLAQPAAPLLCPVWHLQLWHAASLAQFGKLRRDQPVLLLASGVALTARAVNAHLHRREAALGWPVGVVTSHAFRISKATWLRIVGAPQRLVYKHLDWRDPAANSVAERVYCREGATTLAPFVARVHTVTASDVERGQPAVPPPGDAIEPPRRGGAHGQEGEGEEGDKRDANNLR